MNHQPKVKCVVSTCNHYLPNNYCGAARIDIWHQQEGIMSTTIEKTECKSFHKREGALGMIAALHNVNFGGLVSSILPGTQVTPAVHCIVSTCTYWGDGDVCHAQAIEVTGDGADECEDTDCQTFELSEEGQRAPTRPRI